MVYEAKDRDLGRQVAVKVVRPGRITEEEGKVSREAEAIARLSHPNLITLHEVGRSEHGPFLVFELLRGKTLDLRIEEGPLPVQEAVHIATEVARGLAHAHAEGVIHRDLKPANVFVTNKGQVKILDFGMAHAFGRRRLSGGTPAYMAPEQWEDEPEDERTDVFALGVMLYRMLTGEYPFPEGQGKWSSEPATLRKLDVPGAPDLAELVEKMLDRTPKGRPRDGAAVLAALTPIEERLRAKPADGKPPEHAKRRKATFGDLLAELRRRHVFRVMIGYGVFAFAVLQVTEPIMHGADLPDWVLKVVLVALVLGFPVAVILAWVYDLTAQGVKRTPSTTDPGAPRFGRSRLLLPLAVSAVVLAIATIGAGAWYAWKGASGGRHPGASVPVAGPDGRIMVAVADFVNDTKDPDLDGLSSQLITSLEQSQKLRVLTRSRMVDVLRQLGKATVPVVDEVMGREMARAAGVQALVVASIRRFDQLYAIDLKVLDPGDERVLLHAEGGAGGEGGHPGDARPALREGAREAPRDAGRGRRVQDRGREGHDGRLRGMAALLRGAEARGSGRGSTTRSRSTGRRWPPTRASRWPTIESRTWGGGSSPRRPGRPRWPRPSGRSTGFRPRSGSSSWPRRRRWRGARGCPCPLRTGGGGLPTGQGGTRPCGGDVPAENRRWAEALPWFERVRALDPVRGRRERGDHRRGAPGARQERGSRLRGAGVGGEGPRTRSSRRLVDALIRTGRPAEAVEAARRLMAMAPGADSRYALASSLIAADRFEEVESLLEPFVQRDSDPARSARRAHAVRRCARPPGAAAGGHRGPRDMGEHPRLGRLRPGGLVSLQPLGPQDRRTQSGARLARGGRPPEKAATASLPRGVPRPAPPRGRPGGGEGGRAQHEEGLGPGNHVASPRGGEEIRPGPCSSSRL